MIYANVSGWETDNLHHTDVAQHLIATGYGLDDLDRDLPVPRVKTCDESKTPITESATGARH